MKLMSLDCCNNAARLHFCLHLLPTSTLIVDFTLKMWIIYEEHKPEIILEHAKCLQKGPVHNVSPEIVPPGPFSLLLISWIFIVDCTTHLTNVRWLMWITFKRTPKMKCWNAISQQKRLSKALSRQPGFHWIGFASTGMRWGHDHSVSQGQVVHGHGPVLRTSTGLLQTRECKGL